jgi:transcriptional regulator with XRE-family HTH domain
MITGRNIKRFREDRSITRKKMAELLGLTINGYGKIERGEVELTIGRLQEIADILKIPIIRFFENGTLNSGLPVLDIAQLEKPAADEEDTIAPLINFDHLAYIEFLENRIAWLKSKLKNQ